MSLIEEAKQTKSLSDLISLIEKLSELPANLESSEVLAAAILGVIFFMLEVDNKKFDMPGALSDALLTTMENLISSKNIVILQLIKLARMLHPAKGTNTIFIDEETYEILKEEARECLQERPDATDDKRYYWASLAKGDELPPRIVVRKK